MDRNIYLLKDVIATGVGASERSRPINKTFQAVGKTSSGTGAASINVEVSNNNSDWILAGTISLTLGTTISTDGFQLTAGWLWARGNLTSISGTGATVSLIMGL